ncbi:ATP-binding cassette domain-containing protein [Labrenzia sp. VG12]|uniref:ATP-binding cassette domain-containing protein n=1 Tax=Labrenzia sp. VG12 TaxID=2021862 RepID=UPI000B8BC08C|nr:ATP-binding cassette domain-containing protein [Labrenzia sp. VG12]ASP34322.1 ABC transporter ATP-binding protein [Labrenzia sp. VG12]
MRDLSFSTAPSASALQSPVETTPLLETRGLSFSAGGTRLLNQVDLTIRHGSRTLIMGPNGAGKSLLLRLLHGLLEPDTGTVLWQGAKLDSVARKAQAMVFQRPVLLRRSVFANLKFALAVRGLRGKDQADRIGSALASAGLSHLAKRPARVLSGGEQQRLSLVRALACDPELLFLDEPTANLDPASTAAIEQLVLDANRRGVTIVMVTHDAGQAKRLGEDVIFLQDGTVVETGPVDTVLNAPQSEPVRAWRDGRLYLGPNTQSLHAPSGRPN